MGQVVVSLLVDEQRKYSSDDKSQGLGKAQAILAQICGITKGSGTHWL